MSGSVSFTRLTGALGAVVEGVRLADLDDGQFAVLHQGLLDHQVLLARDQHLDDEEHLALARRFGEPMVFPVARLLGGAGVLSRIEDNVDSPPDADSWHTDVTWWPEPPKIAVLCALDVPRFGGDTLWASLYTAYDSLSGPMQRLCEGLSVFHEPGEKFIAANARILGPEVGRAIAEKCTGAVHPLVRTHDETGRQALFLSHFMDHIVGMHRDESDALLGYLKGLVDDPNGYVRWRWQAGDVAIWDERSTEHRALADHYPEHRLMRRCTVTGGRPAYQPSAARVTSAA